MSEDEFDEVLPEVYEEQECPNCGKMNEEEANFCSDCGMLLHMEQNI